MPHPILFPKRLPLSDPFSSARPSLELRSQSPRLTGLRIPYVSGFVNSTSPPLSPNGELVTCATYTDRIRLVLGNLPPLLLEPRHPTLPRALYFDLHCSVYLRLTLTSTVPPASLRTRHCFGFSRDSLFLAFELQHSLCLLADIDIFWLTRFAGAGHVSDFAVYCPRRSQRLREEDVAMRTCLSRAICSTAPRRTSWDARLFVTTKILYSVALRILHVRESLLPENYLLPEISLLTETSPCENSILPETACWLRQSLAQRKPFARQECHAR
ncbi:uncharacterized protein PG998_012996 [Apiospora kogelbergensis]|uniref:uncharacterized protein n=1 Tax=Apiospora kogelbergensis TaxID=1337665 RepID=UPI0031309D38